MAGNPSKKRANGKVSKREMKVVTACSFAGSNFVRDLKFEGKFFRKIDLIAKAKLEHMAILAAFVVSSLLMLLKFRFPSVDAYATP